MNPCTVVIYTLPTIDFIAGATQELVFDVFFRSDSTPFSFDGNYTAQISIVNYVNKSATPLTKAMTVNPLDNSISVTLAPSDTIDLYPGKYIYQITIKDSSGVVEPPSQGIMRISRNIDTGFIKQQVYT